MSMSTQPLRLGWRRSPKLSTYFSEFVPFFCGVWNYSGTSLTLHHKRRFRMFPLGLIVCVCFAGFGRAADESAGRGGSSGVQPRRACRHGFESDGDEAGLQWGRAEAKPHPNWTVKPEPSGRSLQRTAVQKLRGEMLLVSYWKTLYLTINILLKNRQIIKYPRKSLDQILGRKNRGTPCFFFQSKFYAEFLTFIHWIHGY